MKDSNSSKHRLVNVHHAKTHLSRLMDDAHSGETVVLAKAGRPWARLMPLEPPPAQRIPGRLSAFGPLQHPEALLEPLSPEELASWEASSLFQAPPQP